MNEVLINSIYNNCIKDFLIGIDTNQDELSIAYKKYLLEVYGDTLEANDDINVVITIYTNIERKKWKNKTLNEKLSIVINDDSLNKLRELSGIAQKHAERKLGFMLSGTNYTPSISEEDVKKYIQDMKEYHSKVLPQNINVANIYLSEGILDFEYAINLTENLSLRVSHLK